MLERFKAALGALPEGQRVVVVLRDVEGFSTREAAEMRGVSSDAVKMRLSRARARSRRGRRGTAMTDPTSAHEHLGSDSAEGAAHRYLEAGDLPECETCGSEVRELARYFSAGQLLGRRHADLPGTPAANAIRELRRRSYPRRALAAIAATLAPGGGSER